MYALDKWIQSKCKFSDFQLLAWKLTKFLMLFFKPHVSFPLKFASTFSVMTHNSSEIFLLKSYIFWTKRAHQCTIFQTFECSNQSSPNSPCHFWNHKITFVYFFSSNLIYFGQRETIEVTFLDFWVLEWKFTKFLMSYLKPQESFSLNLASLFGVTRDNSYVLFSRLNLIWFGQKCSLKC